MDVSILSSYSSLESNFGSLLNHPIQTFRKRTPTLLSVAGFPDYENVFSNLYQFFLNDREYGMGKLFFVSLLDCIKNSDSQVPMDSWIVKKEVTTPKGGRIDLAIVEDAPVPENVIIIENKIYHHFLNDLDDYLDTYREVKNKIGIVLSLYPLSCVKPPYLNITHQEWIGAVKQRVGNSLADIDLRNLAFLKDFIQHVDSYYENSITMDSYKFLFDNAQRITALNELQAKANEQIKLDLQKNIPGEWDYYRAVGASVAFKRKDISLFLYVTTDSLFKGEGSSYQLQLWVKGHDLVNQWKVKGHGIVIQNGIKLQNNEGTKEWTLVATKKYPVRFDELLELNKIVVNKVKEEWEDLVLKIKEEVFALR